MSNNQNDNSYEMLLNQIKQLEKQVKSFKPNQKKQKGRQIQEFFNQKEKIFVDNQKTVKRRCIKNKVTSEDAELEWEQDFLNSKKEEIILQEKDNVLSFQIKCEIENLIKSLEKQAEKLECNFSQGYKEQDEAYKGILLGIQVINKKIVPFYSWDACFEDINQIQHNQEDFSELQQLYKCSKKKSILEKYQIILTKKEFQLIIECLQNKINKQHSQLNQKIDFECIESAAQQQLIEDQELFDSIFGNQIQTKDHQENSVSGNKAQTTSQEIVCNQSQNQIILDNVIQETQKLEQQQAVAPQNQAHEGVIGQQEMIEKIITINQTKIQQPTSQEVLQIVQDTNILNQHIQFENQQQDVQNLNSKALKDCNQHSQNNEQQTSQTQANQIILDNVIQETQKLQQQQAVIPPDQAHEGSTCQQIIENILTINQTKKQQSTSQEVLQIVQDTNILNQRIESENQKQNDQNSNSNIFKSNNQHSQINQQQTVQIQENKKKPQLNFEKKIDNTSNQIQPKYEEQNINKIQQISSQNQSQQDQQQMIKLILEQQQQLLQFLFNNKNQQ